MTGVPPKDAPNGGVGSVDGVLALLRTQGRRVTSSRRFLLEALFDRPGDRTAEELAAEIQTRAPDVHLSTIYRNLEELEQLGVVVHAHLGHGPAVYHLTASAHGHLVCELCGGTIEAPDDVFSAFSTAVKSRYDFEIDPYHFAVPGRCARCRRSMDGQPAADAPSRDRPDAAAGAADE
jgi:Fe2+ or Zn2+ uptake regulation protein